MKPSRVEALLRLVLRLEGSVALLALFAVVMPYAWMDATHQWLGLGRLPDQPIVGYLARSLSAFYALLGALLWWLSFDVQRHRSTLCFLGSATVVFGAIVLGIDWFEGLPRAWTVFEGPWVMLIGGVIAWLARALEPARAGRAIC
jgi:hypothetical protein